MHERVSALDITLKNKAFVCKFLDIDVPFCVWKQLMWR